MSFLFRKKQTVQAFAVTLEDGREIANREITELKYRREYQNEPMFDILVRVEPTNEPPFEAKMKAGISKTFLLITGVRVQVQYDPTNHRKVTIDDDLQAILARNPQLSKKE
jgi:hypothetical protein